LSPTREKNYTRTKKQRLGGSPCQGIRKPRPLGQRKRPVFVSIKGGGRNSENIPRRWGGSSKTTNRPRFVGRKRVPKRETIDKKGKSQAHNRRVNQDKGKDQEEICRQNGGEPETSAQTKNCQLRNIEQQTYRKIWGQTPKNQTPSVYGSKTVVR